MTKNQKKVIEQPDAYSKMEFPFGSIVAAYVDSRHELNLTYWGKDGVFEQVILQGGLPISSRVGSYDSRKVSSTGGLFPRNLLGLRKRESLEVITAAEQTGNSTKGKLEQTPDIRYNPMSKLDK